MAVTEDGAPGVGAYCREVEAYLCRRNGGHLVRIVGPAFELVAGWASRGVPVKIVCRGIDRRIERREARGGGGRRPVRIEFCEHDVLEVFDEWRRAVGGLGLAAAAGAGVGPEGAEEADAPARGRGPSLPAQVERAQRRLSSILAGERLAETLRERVERVVRDLDIMRTEARTARGEARQALLERLRGLDSELGEAAWRGESAERQAELAREAAQDLAAFRSRMPEDTWRRTVQTAARRLLCERLGLPSLSFE